MDLRTRYLGLELANPLLLGASPVADDLGAVRRAEDSGVAGVVLRSLFEEQLSVEEMAHHRATETHAESFAEATSWLPPTPGFALGPDEYLEQVRKLKAAVKIPVIGSLNGVTPRGWLRYAELIEEAGADALELNVYQLATDPAESGESIETRILEMVSRVRQRVRIPLAVKLSPFHTALPHFASRLAIAGASGIVLFNRFYQPDIDVEELEIRSKLQLSTSAELLMRLHFVAILFGRVDASLALSGGVHDAIDVVKSIMAGANVVQMVSAILERGPEYFRTVLTELGRWLEEHDYESLRQMQGSMSLSRCPDPRAYERANYINLLSSWREPAFVGAKRT